MRQLSWSNNSTLLKEGYLTHPPFQTSSIFPVLVFHHLPSMGSAFQKATKEPVQLTNPEENWSSTKQLDLFSLANEHDRTSANSLTATRTGAKEGWKLQPQVKDGWETRSRPDGSGELQLVDLLKSPCVPLQFVVCLQGWKSFTQGVGLSILL